MLTKLASIYQLYNTQTASAAAVTFDIRANGTLRLVTFAATFDGGMANNLGFLALSWLNSNTLANNDQLGNIAIARHGVETDTSGTYVHSLNFSQEVFVNVEAGERLYFWVSTGTGVVVANAMLHIEDGLESNTAARRRR